MKLVLKSCSSKRMHHMHTSISYHSNTYDSPQIFIVAESASKFKNYIPIESGLPKPTNRYLRTCISTHYASSVDSGRSSSTNESRDRSSNFSVKNRVLSINPNWTAATLLWLAECISRFPCRRLFMGEDCAPSDAMVATFFNRDWIV